MSFMKNISFIQKKDKDIWINNAFNDFFRFEFCGLL